MYKEVRSGVRVGNENKSSFAVRVGFHQGSVHSPLLFVIGVKALSMKFRTGFLWEILNVDELSAQSLNELLSKLNTEIRDGEERVEYR